MNKRCTNPKCRKIFSTLEFGGVCPHCGKKYPQIGDVPLSRQIFDLRVVSFDVSKKVAAIKCLRNLLNTLGLKEAKDTVEGTRCLEKIQGETAEKVRAELKKFGANVEITRCGFKKMLLEKKKTAAKRPEPEKAKKAASKAHRAKVRNFTLEELNLSVRAFNCLKRAGLNCTDDILRECQTAEDFTHIRSLGRKSMAEIIEGMRAAGIPCPKSWPEHLACVRAQNLPFKEYGPEK